MARISSIDPQNRPDLAQLVDKITGDRGGRVSGVYRMLLHSPAISESWLHLGSSLRTQTQIDEPTKELALMRVAILNGVDYILRTHIERYASDAGLTEDQIKTLAVWHSSQHFERHHRALLAYVDAMTRDIDVSDQVFDALRVHYNERQVVEITVLIGFYNMHSRVLKALKIDPEPAYKS